eukprot:gene36053-44647_t
MRRRAARAAARRRSRRADSGAACPDPAAVDAIGDLGTEQGE